jgi:hypothetical protein
MPLAATRPTASGSRGTYDDPIKHTSSYQQQQGMHLGGQPYPRSEQQPLPALHPLLGAHPRLKYAQMGHSSYGRGAPHICYMQVGNQGLFYSRAHQEQDQGQKQPSSWGQLAAHITHAAAGFVHGSSSRGTSLLASAAATGGAAAALPSDGASAPAKQPMGSTTSSSSSTGSGSIEVKPQWHALVLQALALAAVLLVGGLVLKHFFRSVVAALVACYSGLPFKA